MPIIVDLYTPRPSWLHALDPRVKLLFVACFIFLLLFYNNLLFMAGVLALLHLIYGSAKIPRQKIIFIWKTLLPISLLMALLRVIFYPVGTPLTQIWVIQITPFAMAQGLVLGLRIITMAFVVFAWLYTTDQPSLVRSLVKLGAPYEWGLVLALALRYIPTFQGTYTLISEAQQARGLDISVGSGFKRVQVMMPIFVAMIITSLRSADQLGKALEARALGASGVRRTNLRDIHFQPADYVAAIFIIGVTVGLIYVRLRFGFGLHPIHWVG
jgi:energy-coupling factor transport system permease protein